MRLKSQRMELTFEDLDRKNIWHPFEPLQGPNHPIFIESAKGIYLETADGRKIIDAVSSWWVNIHGHANPDIAKAIALQARKLEHVIFAGFTHEPAITLSKNLLSILPLNQQKIFFSDNGSTAVEVALKMSFQYWYNKGLKKKKLIAIDGAYHGDTFGSMSVGERGIFTKPFNDFLFGTMFLDFPNQNDQEVIEQFSAMAKDGEVGTLIFEPLIQGAAGMRTYEADILDKLISIAQANNIICIADEVFTGFGRTGKLFASNHLSNQPDIIALSKGITGGALPLGVTSCSKKITDAFQTSDFSKTFFHGHSYTGNPLSCAAANASFELLMKSECQENIRRISSQQSEFVQRILDHKNVIVARALGTIMAIEIKSFGATTYDNEIRSRIYPFFLERNILLRPLGNVIYVVPPYVITRDELETIHSAIEEFLNSLT
jgi:adenosylmethionine---8-amino-7-oxononanoate aminotransferase